MSNTNTAPALSSVTPSPAPTPSAPKVYTLAEVDAASPFSVLVTWENLVALLHEATTVYVQFNAFAAAAPTVEVGRAMEVPKSAVLERAQSAAQRHGHNEFVRVYTMGRPTICFGI